MSIEQALIARARPRMMVARFAEVLQREATKGCDPEIVSSPLALEPFYQPINLLGSDDGTREPPWTLEPPTSPNDLVRLDIWTSPRQSCPWIRAELFLKQLVATRRRVAFEVVGNRERIPAGPDHLCVVPHSRSTAPREAESSLPAAIPGDGPGASGAPRALSHVRRPVQYQHQRAGRTPDSTAADQSAERVRVAIARDLRLAREPRRPWPGSQRPVQLARPASVSGRAMSDCDPPCAFVTKPQAKPCRCAITAWEYATGIPRSTIASELGHDGCTRATDSAERLAAGSATTEDLLGYTGVDDAELLWWAYKRNINVATVIPKEVCLRDMPLERQHEGLHCPTQSELLDLLPGKVAVVSIFLDKSRRIAHCLAWVDKYALDPSVPAIVQPFDLHAQQIRVVHLLPEIDAGTRLSKLTEQPSEGHSDHGT